MPIQRCHEMYLPSEITIETSRRRSLLMPTDNLSAVGSIDLLGGKPNQKVSHGILLSKAAKDLMLDSEIIPYF
ncbi:hypothetical protein [Fischerella thermalis]|uniref:hypothetical protein n=1 Tax=Fischerella thermalis TaxID=372787 RepID=UPI0011AED24E|nr:hypothetical protein [Fischerella thermalis]MBF2068541.1 hypothetical protein [Fischerella thermalis M48_A2018_028]